MEQLEKSIDGLKMIGLLIIALLCFPGCTSVEGKVETPTPKSSLSSEPTHDAVQDREETITPDPALSPLIPAPGFIAFATYPEREVLMIDPGEDEPVHLTTLPPSAFFSAISPDASQIAYIDVQDDSTTYPILVMDINNGDLKQIANDFEVFGGRLVWSSDGGSIAFAGNQNNVRTYAKPIDFAPGQGA